MVPDAPTSARRSASAKLKNRFRWPRSLWPTHRTPMPCPLKRSTRCWRLMFNRYRIQSSWPVLDTLLWPTNSSRSSNSALMACRDRRVCARSSSMSKWSNTKRVKSSMKTKLVGAILRWARCRLSWIRGHTRSISGARKSLKGRSKICASLPRSATVWPKALNQHITRALKTSLINSTVSLRSSMIWASHRSLAPMSTKHYLQRSQKQWVWLARRSNQRVKVPSERLQRKCSTNFGAITQRRRLLLKPRKK